MNKTRKKKYKKRGGTKMKLYHGTTNEKALSILKNGFDFNRIGENWGTTYGKGIYLTPEYETAKFYAGENGVVLGFTLDVNPYKLTKDVRPKSRKKIVVPVEFDSIINPKGDEVVVLDKNVFTK
tara:strand:+ start:832 stop:1203 length:372 start_codon:yes stop_codon:yes gene_type:complete